MKEAFFLEVKINYDYNILQLFYNYRTFHLIILNHYENCQSIFYKIFNYLKIIRFLRLHC